MEKLNLTLSNDLNFIDVIDSLALCIICSFVLKYLFLNKSSTIGNKRSFSNLLPILSIITFLVILTVKSSIALSLGLVGALSIVRFRTPIKEPEELIFLFLSISLGLGFAANQDFYTFIIFVIISIVILYKNKSDEKNESYNLTIEWMDEKLDYDVVIKEVKNNFSEISLERLSISEGQKNLNLKIQNVNQEKLKNLTSNLKKLSTNINISFFNVPEIF
tara:strand:- start:245 stop:901 length:657 start_codon:yes stop_codon:yes gene_type:complete